MVSRFLRSVAFWTPWQLLLGFALAAVLWFAATPLIYNPCTGKLDVNPAHVCNAYFHDGKVTW